MSRIYKITDRTNNKVYIGQTKRDIYKRFAEHIYRALNSQRKNDRTLAIYIAIVNHKPENFQVELLENVEGTPKQVDEREIYWIKQYDSTNPDKGYNLDKGGHVISEVCRKAAEKHLFKTGDKLEGKMLENARANGMKVAKKYCNSIKKQLNLLQNILVLWKLADLQVVTADLFNGNYKVNMEIHLLLEVGQI